MRPLCRLSVFVLVLTTGPAFGQISWNFNYLDGNISAGGYGFADGTVVGSTTVGQLRRDSVNATAAYMNTILDGRGTINATWNQSLNVAPSGGGVVLGSFGGSTIFPGGEGSFSNSLMYTRGRTGISPSADADGSGQINFNSGVGWHYAVPGTNTTLSGGGFTSGGTVDLISVLAHEIGHGLGFTSFANQSSTVGAEGQFTEWNRNMVRGSTNPSAMFVTDKTQANFGTFIGPVDTFTNGNDSNTGLFFNGSYSREVFAGGGPVPLFAPSSFQPGSSLSHVNDSTALMNPSVSTGVTRRFLAYEIAMMMDLGWNTYNWNGTKSSAANTGNWSEGISTLSDSRWTTEKGITFNSGGAYNVNSNQREAPILPVYGQVTANIALNFTNSGTTSYTSTNDIGTVRLARLNLNSTSTGTTTIAGGTLNFGANANGSASVLVPKIVQSGSGAVTISSTILVNNIATQTVDGVSFAGHSGLTVDGAGTGTLTLSGNVINGNTISGVGGGLTKAGTFTLVTTGTNSYTGATTVNGGTLLVNGNSGGATGAVSVNNTATLAGTGTLGGAITVNSGGTLEGGTASTVGTLTVNNNVTVNTGGTLRAEISGASSDRINMQGGTGANVLTLGNNSILSLSASSFSTSTTYILADLGGTGTSLLVVNGSGVGINTTISTFTFTSSTAGSSTGAVVINANGFNLTAGDRLLLRRDGNGDLVLSFTPVPEPAGVLLVVGLASAGGLAWRRWRKRTTEATLAA